MNRHLAKMVVEELQKKGVSEVCICAGARNAPLVYALSRVSKIKLYHWFEERSASFFAIGRSRATERPVAVITTSGTAAGELLPAAMEAYYTGVPLLLITADRPRCFRGSGAPQSAEQVGLYGCYTPFSVDITSEDQFDLGLWSCLTPAHVNVCFDEPCEEVVSEQNEELLLATTSEKRKRVDHDLTECQWIEFQLFMKGANHPVVIIGTLPLEAREPVIRLLIKLQLPVYAEATSGIREEDRVAHLRILCIDHAWKLSSNSEYPIDAVLRIGGIPTARFWRDLEENEGSIAVCSISEQPFSGLSWSRVIHCSIDNFCQRCIDRENLITSAHHCGWSKWKEVDQKCHQSILEIIDEEPHSEVSLVYALSKKIPESSKIYLGNSQPIREWDLAATYENRRYQVGANRGLNGIDGQIATFLGWSTSRQSNWAILGDLTALYDMAAPWIISQLGSMQINIVVINNRGGKIFARKFSNPSFYNEHTLDFSHLAALWRLTYEKWTEVPGSVQDAQARLIEISPDEDSSHRFWKKLSRL